MTVKNVQSHRISDAKYRKKLALTHDRMIFSIPKILRSEFADCLSKDERYSSATEFFNKSIKRYIKRQSKATKKGPK